jgi:hypothetical protein
MLSRRLFAGGSFIKHGEVAHAAVAVLIGPDQLVIVILAFDVVVANFDRDAGACLPGRQRRRLRL